MTTMQQSSTPSVGERVLLLIWAILLFVAGLFLLARPAISAVGWVEILSIVWLIGGVFDIVNSITTRGRHWGWRLAGGGISILAALYIIFNPLLGSTFVISVAFLMLAIAAVIRGILTLIIGFREHGGYRWTMFILGGLLIIIGVWLLLNPLVGMLSLITLFGVLLIVGSVLVVFLALFGK